MINQFRGIDRSQPIILAGDMAGWLDGNDVSLVFDPDEPAPQLIIDDNNPLVHFDSDAHNKLGNEHLRKRTFRRY